MPCRSVKRSRSLVECTLVERKGETPSFAQWIAATSLLTAINSRKEGLKPCITPRSGVIGVFGSDKFPLCLTRFEGLPLHHLFLLMLLFRTSLRWVAAPEDGACGAHIQPVGTGGILVTVFIPAGVQAGSIGDKQEKGALGNSMGLVTAGFLLRYWNRMTERARLFRNARTFSVVNLTWNGGLREGRWPNE